MAVKGTPPRPKPRCHLNRPGIGAKWSIGLDLAERPQWGRKRSFRYHSETGSQCVRSTWSARSVMTAGPRVAQRFPRHMPHLCRRSPPRCRKYLWQVSPSASTMPVTRRISNSAIGNASVERWSSDELREGCPCCLHRYHKVPPEECSEYRRRAIYVRRKIGSRSPVRPRQHRLEQHLRRRPPPPPARCSPPRCATARPCTG